MTGMLGSLSRAASQNSLHPSRHFIPVLQLSGMLYAFSMMLQPGLPSGQVSRNQQSALQVIKMIPSIKVSVYLDEVGAQLTDHRRQLEYPAPRSSSAIAETHFPDNAPTRVQQAKLSNRRLFVSSNHHLIPEGHALLLFKHEPSVRAPG